MTTDVATRLSRASHRWTAIPSANIIVDAAGTTGTTVRLEGGPNGPLTPAAWARPSLGWRNATATQAARRAGV
jgi:hypothetical protein